MGDSHYMSGNGGMLVVPLAEHKKHVNMFLEGSAPDRRILVLSTTRDADSPSNTGREQTGRKIYRQKDRQTDRQADI